MRILLVLGHSNPFAGAAWRRIEHFAQSWNSDGHEIDILGTFSWRTLHNRGSNNHTGYQTHNFVPIINLSSIFAFILNFTISLVSIFIYLIIKRPNVVVVSMPPGSVGIGTIGACILSRCAYVIDYRDEWESVSISSSKTGIRKSFRLMVSRLVVSLYNNSKHVVTVTNRMAINLKKRGVREVFVIMNGADVNIFSPSKSVNKNPQFTMLYIGGISGYYKIEIILKALAHLFKRGINELRFLFAGSGEINGIMSYAKSLGIDDKIQYLGIIQGKNTIARLIQSVDIGLIPYDDNPLWKNVLPAKLFEYCACGIPILATAYNDSELSKVIHENKIGLVTPPLDSDRLADAILWTKQNPQEVESYGKNARNMVLKHYDRNIHSKNFLKLLENST